MTAQGENILAWLGAAIARREDVARAAANLQDDPENGWGIVDDSSYAQPGKRRTISPYIGITHEPESAEHIVLNNPADVLRRCAADRKLLELHYPQQDGSPFIDSFQCRTCSQDGGDGYQYLVPFPCPTVLAIAEGYGWTGGER
jgi:hypothetical protein